MIHRDIFATLAQECANTKITALTGPRQVGKTTALQQLYKQLPNAHYITFDNQHDKTLFETNIDLFIAQHITPYTTIFIDEFQYAKQGGKQLKYIHDTHKKKLFISGSSQPDIAIQSLQYLVGRVSLLHMHPLSFKEFVQYKSPQKSILLEQERTVQELTQLEAEFLEYLMFGGYPDVVKELDFTKKKKILADLVHTYLFKEIKDIMGYKNIDNFERIITLLATQNGHMIKLSSLAEKMHISWHTIKEHITTLVKTDLLIPVKPFATNKSKEITKTAKYYFHDNGFINSLLNNFATVTKRVDKGTTYETFVLHELQKRGHTLKFWNKQESEVDFVIEQDGNIIAIECKSTINKIPRSLRAFMQNYNVQQAIVFNESKHEHTKNIQYTHYMNASCINFNTLSHQPL